MKKRLTKIIAVLTLLILVAVGAFATEFKVGDASFSVMDAYHGMKTAPLEIQSMLQNLMNPRIVYFLTVPSENQSYASGTGVLSKYLVITTQDTFNEISPMNSYAWEAIKEQFLKMGSSDGGNMFEESLKDVADEYSAVMSLADLSEPRIVMDERDIAAYGIMTVVETPDGPAQIFSITGLLYINGYILNAMTHTRCSSYVDVENAIGFYQDFIRDFKSWNSGEDAVRDRFGKIVSAFISEPTKNISYKDDPKALGLDISLEVPASWIDAGSKRPHTMASFDIKSDDDLFMQYSVVINEIPRFASDYSELDDEFLVEMLEESMPEGAKLLSSGPVDFAGRPSAYITMSYEVSLTETISRAFYLTQTATLVQDRIVMSNFGVADYTGESDPESLGKVFDPLRLYLYNGAYIQNPPGKPASQVNSVMVLSFVLYVIVPLAVLIILACIVRFGVMRRPVSSGSAFIASLILVLIPVILLFNTDDDLISVMLLALGGLAFYIILRIGHDRYDQEMEKREREKEDLRNRMSEAEDMRARAAEDRRKASDAMKNADEARKRAESEKREAEEKRRAAEEAARRAERKRQEAEAEAARAKASASQMNVVKDDAYYEKLLGLGGSYTAADLKKAYREKVCLYHPDRVEALGPKLREVADREMKDINAGYERLSRKF